MFYFACVKYFYYSTRQKSNTDGLLKGIQLPKNFDTLKFSKNGEDMNMF